MNYYIEAMIVYKIGRTEKIDKIAACNIKTEFPAIPDDYLSFLQEIGFGDICLNCFMLYSGPVDPSDIYDKDTAIELEGVLMIGDDYQGYCVGFDAKNDWKIVEYDTDSSDLYVVADSFAEFICEKIASLEKTKSF